MATTTHDDGFHEIQLNGKQLVFLFMAGTVVAVVIFLLGVFVGRGVNAQVPQVDPLAAEDAAVTVPDAPAAAPATTAAGPVAGDEKLAYSDHLTGAERPKETLKPAPDAVSARSAPTAPAARSAASTASAPGEPPGDGFAIQLTALAKREEADAVVRRLTSKGYSAYVLAPAAGAPPVYRVRVGKFKDRREAESVSSRLQKEEQFKPWIVR
jgi:cell division septation protein DedD